MAESDSDQPASGGKRKACYFVPDPVWKAVNRLTVEARIGGKNKWLIVSAAIHALCELTSAERMDIISKVQRADLIGDYSAVFPSASCKPAKRPNHKPH